MGLRGVDKLLRERKCSVEVVKDLVLALVSDIEHEEAVAGFVTSQMTGLWGWGR